MIDGIKGRKVIWTEKTGLNGVEKGEYKGTIRKASLHARTDCCSGVTYHLLIENSEGKMYCVDINKCTLLPEEEKEGLVPC